MVCLTPSKVTHAPLFSRELRCNSCGNGMRRWRRCLNPFSAGNFVATRGWSLAWTTLWCLNPFSAGNFVATAISPRPGRRAFAGPTARTSPKIGRRQPDRTPLRSLLLKTHVLGTARTSPAQRVRWRFAQGLGTSGGRLHEGLSSQPGAHRLLCARQGHRHRVHSQVSTRYVPSSLCEFLRFRQDTG